MADATTIGNDLKERYHFKTLSYKGVVNWRDGAG